MSVFTILFSLSGRIRRRDFWLYSILVTVLIWALNFTAYGLWGHGKNYFEALKLAKTQPLGPFVLSIYTISLLGMLARFPINAKRWHDRNRSAWIAAFMTAFAIFRYGLAIALQVTDVRHAPPVYDIFNMLGLALVVWTFVECGCLDGIKGPNRFGRSPKTPVAQADVF